MRASTRGGQGKHQIGPEAILQATERLFRQYGYEKTGVSDVARELGSSPATIYRFFDSKDDLRRAVFRRFLDASYGMADEILRLPLGAGMRIRKSLEAQFRVTRNLIDHHRKLHDFIVFSVGRNDDDVALQIDRVTDLVEGVIKAGMTQGEFRTQDAKTAASSLVFAASALWHPVTLENRWVKQKVCIDALIDFLLDGLRCGNLSERKPSELP